MTEQRGRETKNTNVGLRRVRARQRKKNRNHHIRESIKRRKNIGKRAKKEEKSSEREGESEREKSAIDKEARMIKISLRRRRRAIPYGTRQRGRPIHSRITCPGKDQNTIDVRNWKSRQPGMTFLGRPSPTLRCLAIQDTYFTTKSAVGSLVVRASDSRPEGLGSMLDVTKYPPSAHGFTCRNCGGGDRGRVAIYRPFGEVSLSLNRTVTCMVLKANDRRTSCPCHDEFRGPRSDYVRQVALATTTTKSVSDPPHVIT
ncbi:uncharacterized protein TNCV_5135921 [Trichonephila clavipes]|nr:uncharacterized protein TNCV_5135921 [Trichonephila clavipes]